MLNILIDEGDFIHDPTICFQYIMMNGVPVLLLG